MNLRKLLFTILLAGVLAASRADEKDSNEADGEQLDNLYNYRLDTAVIPLAYDITIKPYLLPEDGNRQFTFDGSVTVRLMPTMANVINITLHKDYMDILEADLYDSTGLQLIQPFNETEIVYEVPTDKLTFLLHQPLNLSVEYMLHIKYLGTIRTGLNGLFRVNYTDAFGDSKWIAVSQLQRIEARTLFPCFDEPALKAKFRMHISRPNHYNSYFNTRLNSSAPDGPDRTMDHFEETPPMSTYLVAVMVSDFVTRTDEEYSIIMQPALLNYTDFALNVTKKVVTAYGEMTAMPYKNLGNPLMQQAGSPSFPHNGMENWGLVLYRENVLANIANYTDGWWDRQYTLTILAHEIAHMWFGNSVTFAWWSYFWLNEAFARYYQFFMAQQLYPEFELHRQFTINQMHTIFNTDATYGTQPMTSPPETIQTWSQIASKFSSITYAKGACILHMFRHAMGYNNFDAAIRDYLKENHLKATIPADFFKHLKVHWPSNQQVDLDAFFADWTEQVGYPVVSVEIDDDGRKIELKQSRFLLEPVENNENNDLLYTIPISYTTNNERNFDNFTPQFYFNKTTDSLTLHMDKRIDWLILNKQQTFYYRVYYEDKILDGIKAALLEPGFGGIHLLNRAQLINDLFIFGRTGLMPYEQIFEFMEYLGKEYEYTPWYAALEGLRFVTQRLPLVQQEAFGEFLIDISDTVYKENIAKEPIKPLEFYNWEQINDWRCKYKDHLCKELVTGMFEHVIHTEVKPSPDIRETIYCNAMRYGNQSYYEILNKWFQLETNTNEKRLLIRSMACTVHFYEMHYIRILAEEIPIGYRDTALRPLYRENPQNVMPVFRLVTSSYGGLQMSLGGWQELANIMADIANYITTLEDHEEYKQFVEEHGEEFGTSVSTLKQAEKQIENNLEWSSQRLESLFTYLDKRKNNASLVCMVSLPLLALALAFITSVSATFSSMVKIFP